MVSSGIGYQCLWKTQAYLFYGQFHPEHTLGRAYCLINETLTEGLSEHTCCIYTVYVNRNIPTAVQYLGAQYSETMLHDECRAEYSHRGHRSWGNISRHKPMKWGPLVKGEQRCIRLSQNDQLKLLLKYISKELTYIWKYSSNFCSLWLLSKLAFCSRWWSHHCSTHSWRKSSKCFYWVIRI